VNNPNSKKQKKLYQSFSIINGVNVMPRAKKVLNKEQLDHLLLIVQILFFEAIVKPEYYDATDTMITNFVKSPGGSDWAVTSYLQMQNITRKAMDELIEAAVEQSKSFTQPPPPTMDMARQKKIASEIYFNLLDTENKKVSTFCYLFCTATMLVANRLAVFLNGDPCWQRTAAESLLALPASDQYEAARLAMKMKNTSAEGYDAETDNCYYRAQNDSIHEVGRILSYLPYDDVLNGRHKYSLPV
jgi:hypothetical protein